MAIPLPEPFPEFDKKDMEAPRKSLTQRFKDKVFKRNIEVIEETKAQDMKDALVQMKQDGILEVSEGEIQGIYDDIIEDENTPTPSSSTVYERTMNSDRQQSISSSSSVLLNPFNILDFW